MRKFVFDLEGSECCAECSKVFEAGDLIMRRDNDGALFCSECASKNEAQYSRYRADVNCAKLIFDGIYEQLDDGIIKSAYPAPITYWKKETAKH